MDHLVGALGFAFIIQHDPGADSQHQGGRHTARNIVRLLDGKPTEPFTYLDKGQLATIRAGVRFKLGGE